MENMVQIPCNHDNNNNSPMSEKRVMDFVFNYRIYEKCIFMVDEENQIETPYYPYDHGCMTTVVLSPFCRHCHLSLSALFVSLNYLEEQFTSVMATMQGRVLAALAADPPPNDNNDGRLSCSFRLNFCVRYVRNYDDVSISQWAERAGLFEANQVVPAMTPASDKAIEALEKIMVTSSQECTITCAICLEDLMKNEDEVGRRLPCKHEFHEDCILEWLRTSHYCPLCRFRLPTSFV